MDERPRSSTSLHTLRAYLYQGIKSITRANSNMPSPQLDGEEELSASLHGANGANGIKADADDETTDVEAAAWSTNNRDPSRRPSDHGGNERHSDSSEVQRLYSLVSHHKSRTGKFEAENTALRLDLANARFDLEHCRLELRQMTTKRDALRKEVADVLTSKASLARDLGRENCEMISTIDKLETERDVLLEEVEKLREWIVKNKGEEDDAKSNVFRNAAVDRSVEVFGGPSKREAPQSTSQDEIRAWETTLASGFPSTTVVGTKSNGDDIFASGEESASTSLTAADTFDSTDDKLYSDEYLSLVREEKDANNGDDENDDEDSFQSSYHGGSVDTLEAEDERKGATNVKKVKKKRWGISVKPRGRAPKSPNSVSRS